jgi:hypothetical protein
VAGVGLFAEAAFRCTNEELAAHGHQFAMLPVRGFANSLNSPIRQLIAMREP